MLVDGGKYLGSKLVLLQQMPPVGLERMLRIYFLQLWFNLSDPGVEEALYVDPNVINATQLQAAP